MSQGWFWVTIIIIGLLTLGIRLSFMVFMGKVQVSPIVLRALRFVPIAVLSALIAPALFFPGGSLDVSLSNIRLMAGILAILVAWRTKNVLLTILSGMACLLILQKKEVGIKRVWLQANEAVNPLNEKYGFAATNGEIEYLW